MKGYIAPKIPTLSAARKSPALLKKMPRSWQKKAAAFAGFGLLGMLAFAGCGAGGENGDANGGLLYYGEGYATNDCADYPFCEPHLFGENGENYSDTIDASRITVAEARETLENAPLDIRAHFGGAGGGPFYIVYFTEADAFGFIRAKLEEAGLNFSVAPPEISVDLQSFLNERVYVKYFDAERRAGAAFITWGQNNMPFFSNGGDRLARRIEMDFAEQSENLNIGTFFNPDHTVFSRLESWELRQEDEENYTERREETLEERAEPARQALIDNLTAQAQEFIDRLRSDNVL